MKRLLIMLFIATASIGLTHPALAQTPTILTSVGDESDYYKIAALIRSAGIDADLKAAGAITVLAPPNVLFRNMDPGKLDSLQKDPVKLAMVLKAHIIKGKLTKADIIKKLSLGKGKATLTNLLGQPLKLSLGGDKALIVTDVKGNKAAFIKFDMMDPQGVLHGIDNVLIIGK
ncbi:fasciclin domain-containing protein [Mucilaginibacter sp. AW1-3]